MAKERLTQLQCALCFYDPSNEPGTIAKDAVTVIKGYAVCEDHMGYVAGGMEWAAIISAMRGT